MVTSDRSMWVFDFRKIAHYRKNLVDLNAEFTFIELIVFISNQGGYFYTMKILLENVDIVLIGSITDKVGQKSVLYMRIF